MHSSKMMSSKFPECGVNFVLFTWGTKYTVDLKVLWQTWQYTELCMKVLHRELMLYSNHLQ